MKVGLLIATYNRPQYLRQCLESIKRADIPVGTDILIIDDYSTDPETIKIIRDFEIKDRVMLNYVKGENRSIKDSIMIGSEILFNTGCTYIINLDGDAIVSPDFISRLLKLKIEFDGHIVTGFNCRTKNRNGSERHVVINEGEGWNMKKSVGGINMVYDEMLYRKWIYPAILECLATPGNWDHRTCLRAEADGKSIVCAVPSVVQHIGIESSMGHSAGGEPPDVADDFFYSTPADTQSQRTEVWKKYIGRWSDGKLLLPEVTLVGADCIDFFRLGKAASICQGNILFGDVKLFTSRLTKYNENVIEIPEFSNKADYSIFMMKELYKYITTPYIMVIQYDGFVLNPQAWNDEWLKYDYIGAPWEFYSDGMQVGNGGFSLRSKRLHDVLMLDDSIVPINDKVIKNKEEDHNICRLYRKYLENTHGIKFAPVEIARQFSIEAWGVHPPGNKYSGQFGFHGFGVDFNGATGISKIPYLHPNRQMQW